MPRGQQTVLFENLEYRSSSFKCNGSDIDCYEQCCCYNQGDAYCCPCYGMDSVLVQVICGVLLIVVVVVIVFQCKRRRAARLINRRPQNDNYQRVGIPPNINPNSPYVQFNQQNQQYNRQINPQQQYVNPQLQYQPNHIHQVNPYEVNSLSHNLQNNASIYMGEPVQQPQNPHFNHNRR